MMWRRWLGIRSAIALTLLLLAVWQICAGLFIPTKALLAQHLLQDAWRKTKLGAIEVKPWPWADTWPVARLRAPGHDVDLLVLAGVSGESLAFGPGHLQGTPALGQPGNSIIGGHRDTSLAFLEQVRIGEELFVERPDGRELTYRITGSAIADARQPWRSPVGSNPMLTLVTCYPFNAVLPGGPFRYLVFAMLIPLRTAQPSPYFTDL